MATIRQEDLIQSVADALQFISYYHPADYIRALARAYERGKALSAATLFEFDEVIDPAETRSWIMAGLRACPAPEKRKGKKLKWIDAW